MTNQKLTDITRGFQHAAQTTLALVAEQFISMLEQFFDPQEDGTLTAKTVRVEISETTEKTDKGEETTKTFVKVPLISLVAPRGLALNKMQVNMSFRLESAESKKATRFDNSDATRTSFTVAMAPRGTEGDRRKSDVFDVKLDFMAWDPPEAVMRLIDLYTNTITPYTYEKGRKPPKEPYADTKRFQDLLKRNRERQQSPGSEPGRE